MHSWGKDLYTLYTITISSQCCETRAGQTLSRKNFHIRSNRFKQLNRPLGPGDFKYN
ncbi:hypothetical protein Lalb_Chr25g0279321 [Lupinus albus]|uniref:Uncharacterized protein n=1 Tax=Lupinus albus TaxID=3870 RepID=A0A6A4NAL4_LUPAL|nr:hypothetical protein Lalb_Chr25g0279321 [Lupinus albus]